MYVSQTGGTADSKWERVPIFFTPLIFNAEPSQFLECLHIIILNIFQMIKLNFFIYINILMLLEKAYFIPKAYM